MLSRRRFLIGATGIATIPFNFYEKAYSFFQNHNEPLLIPPKDVRETLYLCWDEFPEFRLGEIDPPIPKLTWRELYDQFFGGWEQDHESEQDFAESNGGLLDDLAPVGQVYEAWIVSDAPHIRAYKYLDSLGLREGKNGIKELGDILFVDGGAPGCDYLGVTTDDLFTASLLQHELNKRGTGIKVEIYNKP